jgi:ribosome maturation factor RimP
MANSVIDVVEKTVAGLGYELVDVERAPRGLLRITIDQPAGKASGIAVSDCEAVTRQLQFVFEVEGVDYARLEVGSPGVDRPLRKPADFERFAGERVSLVLREAMPGAPGGRKKYAGVLAKPAGDGSYVIEYEGKEGPLELRFTLAEVAEVKLAPELSFKPKKPQA